MPQSSRTYAKRETEVGCRDKTGEIKILGLNKWMNALRRGGKRQSGGDGTGAKMLGLFETLRVVDAGGDGRYEDSQASEVAGKLQSMGLRG